MLKHFLLSIALSSFIITASVIFTLHFTPLYHFDLRYYHLAEETGYSEEEILANYNALIRYNSPFSDDPLQFPTLTMSEEGRIHFEEVKQIFDVVHLFILPISFIFSLLGIILLRKQKPAYLKLTSVISFTLPLIVGLMLLIDWDRLFTLLHLLLFENTYWIFDPQTDPIISFLPDGYFMHCGIMIILLIFLSATLCAFIYTQKIRHHTY